MYLKAFAFVEGLWHDNKLASTVLLKHPHLWNTDNLILPQKLNVTETISRQIQNVWCTYHHRLFTVKTSSDTKKTHLASASSFVNYISAVEACFIISLFSVTKIFILGDKS